MLKRLRSRQDGDTIIEVMISLAILALVLGGAYYTASTSFRNDRAAQEHSEGLTIAQTQVEDLRAIGATIDTQTLESYNCVSDGSGTLTLESYNLLSADECYVGSNSSNGNVGPEAGSSPYWYLVNITRTGPIAVTASINFYTFDVNVSWPSLGGGNSDQVSLYYRVDQD